MYNEDYLGEEVINYTDEDISVTVDDLSTLDSEIIEERRILKAYKKADAGYYSFKKIVGENLVKIEVFSTTPNMKKIRHAITGLRTPYPVGCKQEDLFFTIVDSSSLAPKSDSTLRRKLYYNSPEEYERHFNVTVNRDTKKIWYDRNRIAKHRLKL